MTTFSVADRPPSVSAAVPGSSGRQQGEEELSHRSKRRRCSSSCGTGRTSKKRPMERSPSPGWSSRHREESYQSSSSPSEEDRAESPPPSSGRAHGGTPGDPRPAKAGDRSPRPGPLGWRLWSSSVAEQYRSGFGSHLSYPPSGEADDDRSSALLLSGHRPRWLFPVHPGPHPELPRHGRAGRYTIGSMEDFSCINLWFDVGDLSGILPAYLSLAEVASGRQ